MSEELNALATRLDAWADPVSSGYEVPAAAEAMREAASALRRLAAAGEQKPVAYLHTHPKDIDDFTRHQLTDADKANGWTETPLFAAPQPAPGWDEAIEACKQVKPDDFGPVRSKQPQVNIREFVSDLDRSSQSTSDAGGGVRDYSLLLLQASYVLKNLNVERPGCGYLKMADGCEQAALSNPAAADSNASAEARLREALFVFREFVNVNVTQWTVGAGDHHHPIWSIISRALGPDRERNRTEAEWRFIQPEQRDILSPDPHASDCETKTIYDVLGDQRTCVGVPASGIAKMMDAVENPKQPNEALKKLMRDHASDCDKQGETSSADVTTDDLVRVIKTVNVDFGGWETDLARAMLRAFTVGRR